MPPILTTARATPGFAKAAAWKAGASGAPSPPAAISLRRKSAMVVMPVSFGNGVGVADLQAETRLAAGSRGRWSMTDGLSVASNRFDVFRLLVG